MYNSSKQVAPAQYLGATRDLLASVDLLVSQYVYSHRIARHHVVHRGVPRVGQARHPGRHGA